MSAQEVLDYLGDLMDEENLRPGQKIDTLLQAIEDQLDDAGDDGDADEECDADDEE